MAQAPLREVIEVRELEGPRGGKRLVHRLSCGCLVWRSGRRPAKQLRCVGCWWREGDPPDEQSARRALKQLYRAAVTHPAWTTLAVVLDIVCSALTEAEQREALGRPPPPREVTRPVVRLREDVAVGEPCDAGGERDLDEEA